MLNSNNDFQLLEGLSNNGQVIWRAVRHAKQNRHLKQLHGQTQQQNIAIFAQLATVAQQEENY